MKILHISFCTKVQGTVPKDFKKEKYLYQKKEKTLKKRNIFVIPVST